MVHWDWAFPIRKHDSKIAWNYYRENACPRISLYHFHYGFYVEYILCVHDLALRIASASSPFCVLRYAGPSRVPSDQHPPPTFFILKTIKEKAISRANHDRPTELGPCCRSFSPLQRRRDSYNDRSRYSTKYSDIDRWQNSIIFTTYRLTELLHNLQTIDDTTLNFWTKYIETPLEGPNYCLSFS